MSAFTPLPKAEQPPWLSQLHLIVKAYAAGAHVVLRCRWCDAGWTLARDYDRETHVWGILDISEHGMQHAVDGDLRLDGDGEPIDPDPDEEEVPF